MYSSHLNMTLPYIYSHYDIITLFHPETTYAGYIYQSYLPVKHGRFLLISPQYSPPTTELASSSAFSPPPPIPMKWHTVSFMHSFSHLLSSSLIPKDPKADSQCLCGKFIGEFGSMPISR